VQIKRVQMPFVDGNIAGLADQKPGMMQCRQHIGQFDQLLQIIDRAIAPPVFQVAHKRRTVDGREDGAGFSDFHGTVRIAGVLNKFFRCRAAQMPGHAARQSHARFLYVRPGLFPDPQRFGILAKLQPDFLDQPIRLILESGQPLFVEKFVKRDLPADIGGRRRRGAAFTLGTAR